MGSSCVKLLDILTEKNIHRVYSGSHQLVGIEEKEILWRLVGHSNEHPRNVDTTKLEPYFPMIKEAGRMGL